VSVRTTVFALAIDAFVESDQSQGLFQLPSLFPFLSRNLFCLGLRDLFISLFRTENPDIPLSSQLFSDLLDGLTISHAFFVITAIRICLRRSPYRIADEYLANCSTHASTPQTTTRPSRANASRSSRKFHCLT
jgi:hypothetical protein